MELSKHTFWLVIYFLWETFVKVLKKYTIFTSMFSLSRIYFGESKWNVQPSQFVYSIKMMGDNFIVWNICATIFETQVINTISTPRAWIQNTSLNQLD